MFFIYLVIMYFNAKFAHLIDSHSGLRSDDSSVDEEAPLLQNGNAVKADRSTEGATEVVGLQKTKPDGYREITVHLDEDDGDWLDDNCFFKYLLLPVTLLFRLTLPKPSKFCFVVTFIVSIAWIGLFTWVCIWMVTLISKLMLGEML